MVAAFAEAAQTRKGESNEPPHEEHAEHGALAHAFDAPEKSPRDDQGREDERGVERRLDPREG